MIYRLYFPQFDNKGHKIYTKGYFEMLYKITDGFTTYDGRGHWKGQTEDVTIVEIVRDGDTPNLEDLAVIESVMRLFKSCEKQEAVFFTMSTGEGILL